jgi:hypothetical protein
MGHLSPRIVSGGDDSLILNILKLLERYEPMRHETLVQILSTQGITGDVGAALIRLLKHGMIAKGHEQSGLTTFENYQITGKGRMAVRQTEEAMA